MGIAYNTSMVRSGLVLHLDAANTKSYVGTGTAWNDISGAGNNGTLVNGPTYSTVNNGSIIFDDTDDHVQIPDSSTLRFETGSFTVSLWAYPEIVMYGSADQGTLISKDFTGFELYIYQGKFNAFIGGASNALNGVATILINNWYNFVLVRNGTTVTTYINSSVDNTVINSANASNVGTSLNIARRVGDATRFYKGRIPSVQIYNRALNTTEIRQNFNALRGRYGI